MLMLFQVCIRRWGAGGFLIHSTHRDQTDGHTHIHTFTTWIFDIFAFPVLTVKCRHIAVWRLGGSGKNGKVLPVELVNSSWDSKILFLFNIFFSISVYLFIFLSVAFWPSTPLFPQIQPCLLHSTLYSSSLCLTFPSPSLSLACGLQLWCDLQS